MPPRKAAKRLSEIRGNEAYAREYLHGKTAPRDAILSAMQFLGDPRFSDSIYVIGDGADNQSRNGAHAVRDALVSKGVRWFVSMLSFGSVIEILLPEPANGWKKWSLELSSDRRKTHKDWFVVYPQELRHCRALPH